MRYGDLIKGETSVKLTMVSFSSAKKNLDVYKFTKSIEPLMEYYENERSKILQRFGEYNGNGTFNIPQSSVADFKKSMDELLELEITDNIYCPDLSENDFYDDNCQYPQDKSFWLNAYDISGILALIDKLKNENRKE